jgi:hypothetical protein
MNKYALIPIELFDEEMLSGVVYPVCIDYNERWKMLEYNEQPDPTGEGWVIFSGDNANIDCAEFIEQTVNEI